MEFTRLSLTVKTQPAPCKTSLNCVVKAERTSQSD